MTQTTRREQTSASPDVIRADDDAAHGVDWTARHIDALLRVSKTATFTRSLDELLAQIAKEAHEVTDASFTAILVAEPSRRFRLVASIGLSDSYKEFVERSYVSSGKSLARMVADELKPIVIDDLFSDPITGIAEYEEGRRFARQEGLSAFFMLPLVSGNHAFGVLTMARGAVSWTRSEIALLETFAQLAAAAIDSAKLLSGQARQLEALERMVEVLSDQTHEYANRLHALAGLQALGEYEEAESFLNKLISLHHDSYASVAERIRHPVIAGLLLAQMSIARQRGVEILLDPESEVNELPDSLGGVEAVTIIANLVDNAVDEVAGLPADRRRASVRIVEDAEALYISIRDYGTGLDPELGKSSFQRGRSSKGGHLGVGLALVADTVAAVHGEINVKPTADGTEFSVTIPGR